MANTIEESKAPMPSVEEQTTQAPESTPVTISETTTSKTTNEDVPSAEATSTDATSTDTTTADTTSTETAATEATSTETISAEATSPEATSSEATSSEATSPEVVSSEVTSPDSSGRMSTAGLEAESAHTDSMVTIRLSGAPATARKSVSFSPLIASSSHDEDSTSEKSESRRNSTDSTSPPTEQEAEPESAVTPKVTSQSTDEAEKADNDMESAIATAIPASRPQSTDVSSLRSNTPSSATAATADDLENEDLSLKRASSQSSLASKADSTSSRDSANVDWEQLDKNEEAEVRDEATDESTAFLLARLERENQILSLDPKAQVTKERGRNQSRPPSMHQLKKMANETTKDTLRYSLLPTPPPMTELEFWSALVRDYCQTAQRLPTLTSNKIRSGIPPPLRGVVWVSIAGARDPGLEEAYDRLCNEPSPYQKLIGKDIGRSFPGVDMFRDPDGDGQKMLGKVLNAYSLWDEEIGYCQGLGFVVGPLIMHMSDKDAFCVLVKLMQSYDLRSCFLPDLSGLKLRIYQFQNLLKQHLPALTEHLDNLKIEPLYVSQWFLSFFGVACPLPMLIRIYDILLTEGASETLMRVALSLMRRNEEKILALTEFEDVMGLLLSRGLWDTYNLQADDLVNDFVGWTGLVTREGLSALETSFREHGGEIPEIKANQKVESAATRFLGRFWPTSVVMSPGAKTSLGSPTLTTPAQADGPLKRTPSKQSMASTLNSVESLDSANSQSTAATDASRLETGDSKPGHAARPSLSIRSTSINKDRDLHTQIEDLLMAMNDLQREQAMLANELQREREEREEDRAVVTKAVGRLRDRATSSATTSEDDKRSSSEDSDDTVTEDPVVELESRFLDLKNKRSSLALQTKLQLRDELTRWKTQFNEEAARSSALSTQLTDKERESKEILDQLREARTRLADAHRDKQRLEKTNRDLRDKSPGYNSARSSIISLDTPTTPKASGLRELRLGRPPTSNPLTSPPAQAQQPVFNKRVSSLSMHGIVTPEESKPADQEPLLLELVNAKTAEAVAKQELEECKAKLDALRKMISGNSPSPGALGHSPGSLSVSSAIGLSKADDKKASNDKAEEKKASTTSGGGWFSGGWGKRAVSGSAS